MDDPVEPRAGVGVGEHDRRERGSVQGAVRGQDAVAERLHDRGQARAARLEDLAGDAVGVDDDRSSLGQQRRDRALPRPDPAGQPDAQHPRTVAIQPKEVTER
jgi:hypothetical protein